MVPGQRSEWIRHDSRRLSPVSNDRSSRGITLLYKAGLENRKFFIGILRYLLLFKQRSHLLGPEYFPRVIRSIVHRNIRQVGVDMEPTVAARRLSHTFKMKAGYSLCSCTSG